MDSKINLSGEGMDSKEFNDYIKDKYNGLRRLIKEYEFLTKKQRDIVFNKAIKTSSGAIGLIEYGSKYLNAKQMKKAFDKAMEDEDYGAISLLENCAEYLTSEQIEIAFYKALDEDNLPLLVKGSVYKYLTKEQKEQAIRMYNYLYRK